MRGRYGGAAALAQLLAEREAIEAEIGDPLCWEQNPEAQDKLIAVHREVDLGDRTRWPEAIDWMVERTRRFRRTFAPRVKRLKLDAEDEPGDDPLG